MNNTTSVQIWIHVGLPKTGTSAVQSTFAREREALRSQGLLYPATGLTGGGHARLAWSLLPDERKARGDVLERLSTSERDALFRELRHEVLDAGCQKVFISSEYFSEVNPARVKASFRAMDADLRVLIYLRRQDELIESGYNQQVKAGLSSEPFQIPGYVASYDYGRRLAEWADVLGRSNVVPRRYNGSVAREGVEYEVARILGIDLPESSLASPEISNPSLHPAVVEVQRIANMLGMTDRRPIEALQSELGNRPHEPGRRLLTFDQRCEILNAYAASNAEVAREYFDDPTGVLFAAPKRDAVAEGSGVPEESLPYLFSLLMWRAQADELAALRREMEQLLRGVQH